MSKITWTPVASPISLEDHNTRHEDAGADEISIAALSGEPATLTTHKDLTTGVHGAGSDTLATNGQAIIWAIVFGG